MTPLETLLSRPPLERRAAAISLIESLMSESDDAHDIYSAAFDAMDDPATERVFEDEWGKPIDWRAAQASLVAKIADDIAKEARHG